MHLIIDAEGKLLYMLCQQGQKETKELNDPSFLDKLKVTGGMRTIEADKGYDCKAVRLEILSHGYYLLVLNRGSKQGLDKWVVWMR